MTHDDDAPRSDAEGYEPPAMTSLGGVAEVTLGHTGGGSDGTFTGSVIQP